MPGSSRRSDGRPVASWLRPRLSCRCSRSHRLLPHHRCTPLWPAGSLAISGPVAASCAGVAQPAINLDLETAGAGKGQQDNGVDPLLFGFRQAVIDGWQYIGAERITHQHKALGAPFLPVVLHQFGQVGGALFRDFCAASSSAACRCRPPGSRSWPFRPPRRGPGRASRRHRRGTGSRCPLLAGRHFDHRHAQAAVVRSPTSCLRSSLLSTCG
jgi:hypothetical protein